MDFKQLHTFAVVARERSFTRASGLLNYAQSSVSAQIQALEHELGTHLFDRIGRSVQLTEVGQKVLPLVHDLLQMESELQSIAKGGYEPSGTLVVGAPESLIAYRLPPALAVFHQRYPRVHLQFRADSCAEHRAALGRGEIDVALLLEQSAPPTGLAFQTLTPERIVLVAHPKITASNPSASTPSLIESAVLLFVEASKGGASYREVFERQTIQKGIRIQRFMEFASVEAVKQCAIAGLGIALLPEMVVQQELDAGKLIRLPWNDLQIPTYLAWRDGRWMPQAAREWIKCVRAYAYRVCQSPEERLTYDI
ncbi:LysR family transcriptional regulator [Alicyclobacillus mali (ex Roth et al. 2021)]|uniref:LysR family transcriptional regulator n=1 Tax=Alicyclobacillus mali (ex Roth et al. 2021) TaxID=1123961 RepID=UPI0008347BB9|nr:LysR family transcriptional regulator [Alicyclobacillus mali (ex Roth et al. 2021)]